MNTLETRVEKLILAADEDPLFDNDDLDELIQGLEELLEKEHSREMAVVLLKAEILSVVPMAVDAGSLSEEDAAFWLCIDLVNGPLRTIWVRDSEPHLPTWDLFEVLISVLALAVWCADRYLAHYELEAQPFNKVLQFTQKWTRGWPDHFWEQVHKRLPDRASWRAPELELGGIKLR